MPIIILNLKKSSHQYTSNESIANNSGSYASGIYSLLNTLGGDSINRDGGATSQSWLNQQASSYDSMSILLDNTIRAQEVRNGSNSTFVKQLTDNNGNIIPNKYVVTDAIKDGDRNIYDEDNNVIGKTIFDDTFIMYGVNGEYVGVATGNTINFDRDITELINSMAIEANSEFTIHWGYESRTGGKYDLKNILSDNDFTKHYDGYIYNGVVITGRGAGNLLFGRNMENSEMMSNFQIKAIAGGYQFLDNSSAKFIEYNRNNNWLRDLGETHEAVRYYNIGIQEQFRINYDENPRREILRQVIKNRGI